MKNSITIPAATVDASAALLSKRGRTRRLPLCAARRGMKLIDDGREDFYLVPLALGSADGGLSSDARLGVGEES